MRSSTPSDRESLPIATRRAGAWHVPVLGILATALFSRGLLVPWLGFYWDDFPTLWAMHVSGPLVMWDFYHSARPFLPWIYMLTAPVAGESPLAWQALGILGWCLAALAVWWLLRSLWPGRRRLALLAALLFVVYPGFHQGPISLIYSHFLLLTALFVFSLGCTVHTVRAGPKATQWFLAALATQALALFSFEYLVGLELARPFIIGLAHWQGGARGRRLLGRSLRIWIPHVLVLLGYLVWRALTPRFPAYEPLLLSKLAAQPGEALAELASRIGGDVFVSTAGAWFAAALPPSPTTLGRLGIAVALSALGGAGLTSYWALGKSRGEDVASPAAGSRHELAQAMAFGGWALLLAGIPVWITLLPLHLGFPWDRMTFPFMFGASILLASLLIAAIGRWRLSVAAFAAVVAIGAAHQAVNSLSYVRAWDDLNGFLAQLTTRAPAISPGTVILANDIPLGYYSDNSLTAPLNWIYAPELDSLDVPYMLYFVTVRLGLGLPALEPGLPIDQYYRPGTFEGSTSQSLVLFYDPPGCLQFLDVRLHDSMPGLPDDVSRAVPLSNLDLIDPSPERPAASPFAPQPDPNWCIHFQRAELARQQENWSEVAEIGDIALASDDRPNRTSEYLPFIEAYGHVGRWEEALAWTETALKRNIDVRRMMCNTWQRMDASMPPSSAKYGAVETAKTLARCER
jgi:hypothetical protein